MSNTTATSINLIEAEEHCAFVMTTKEMVDELLAMNTHNRPMKKYAIDLYAKSQRLGHWTPTNQGIGVTKTGILLDGQNRLEANRLAGYPSIKILLVTGLDEESQMHIDTHARRTQVDLLKLSLNQTISGRCVATLNCRQLLAAHGNPGNRLTIDELANEFAMHGETVSLILASLQKYGKSSVTAALLDYSIRAGLSKAMAFANQIGSGELLERGDAAYTVRQHLEVVRAYGSTPLQISTYKRMISACVAFHRNEKLLMMKETDEWPSLGIRQRSTPAGAG